MVVVEISSDAAAAIAAGGGRLWVWAARPRMCCAGSPAWMHAASAAPDGLSGFAPLPAGTTPTGLQVFFRSVGGLQPDVLEVALTRGRHPKVAAYWDGCLMAMA
jgi:hypothetical protein